MRRGVAPYKKNSIRTTIQINKDKIKHLQKREFSLFLIFISGSLTLTLNAPSPP
jgi:hypothetical protein